MLISEPRVLEEDTILSMVAKLNGNSTAVREIEPGIYEIGHFGSTGFLRDYEHYPDVSVGAYGVCDSAQNLLEKCPELKASDRAFVVTLTKVEKCAQSSSGGWRWHKWGEYIGSQDPQCEYLYDEPSIERVYCFHIYERKAT